MKKLFLLLKYGLKGSNSWGRKKGHTKGIWVKVSYLILISLFVFFTYSFSIFFTNIAQINKNLFILIGYYSILFLSIMGLFNLIPFFVFAFFKNQEIEFLSTLPVKKVYIYIYQLIITLKDNLLFIGTLISIIIGFSLTYSNSILSIIYYIILSLIYSIDLIFISIFFAIIFSKLLSKKLARYIAYIFMMIILMLFVFVIQFREQVVNYFQTPQNVNKISSIIQKLDFLYYNSNPVKYVLLAINSINYFFYILGFTVIIGTFLYFILNKINFSSFYKTTNSKHISFKVKGYKNNLKVISFLKKDLLLIIRNEKAIFMLLYPLLFGIVYAIALKSIYGALFISISISAFYTIMFSIMLLFEDLKAKSITFTLPIKIENMIVFKLIIPIIYNFLIAIIIILFFIIFLKANLDLLLLLPFIFIVNLFSSFIGIYIVNQKGSKLDYKYPEKVLNFGITLILEFIIFLLTFLIVQIPALLLNKNKSFFKVINKNILLKIGAYILPILFILLIIGFIIVNIKKIGKKKFE